MKKTTLIGLGALGATLWTCPELAAQAPAQGQIAETRQTVTDYIFLRQQISKEKNEWRVYEEVSERRIEFFRAEIERLEAQITAAEAQVSSAETTINEKRNQIDQRRAANNVVLEMAPAFEARLQSLAAAFPDPLKDRISPLMGQLGKPRQAAQRMAIVIGILNEVDKFNSEWSLSGTQIDDASVDVLYMGLSIGFYANQDGTVGGLLLPANGEWERRDEPSLAPAIATLIRYYQGDLKPAQLTPLPLEVSNVTGR